MELSRTNALAYPMISTVIAVITTLVFQTGWGGVVGPCGQQNCWYSCTVCMYSNRGECYAEDIAEDDDE